MLDYILFQLVPLIHTWFDVPHIKLQHTLASWTALESLIRTINLSDLHGLQTSTIIDGLKDLFVKSQGLIGVIVHLHHCKDISQSLNPNSNWPVSKIGFLASLYWIVILVNNFVEIISNDSGHFDKTLKVK
jgi:hypothetical protein